MEKIERKTKEAEEKKGAAGACVLFLLRIGLE